MQEKIPQGLLQLFKLLDIKQSGLLFQLLGGYFLAV